MLPFFCSIETFAGPLAAPSQVSSSYSFLEDLNSPNLQSQLSQAELNEIAADPKATESDSSDSDSEEGDYAKVNDDFFSNENASSGLAVSLDYPELFCAKSLI